MDVVVVSADMMILCEVPPWIVVPLYGLIDVVAVRRMAIPLFGVYIVVPMRHSSALLP